MERKDQVRANEEEQLLNRTGSSSITTSKKQPRSEEQTADFEHFYIIFAERHLNTYSMLRRLTSAPGPHAGPVLLLHSLHYSDA